MDGVGVISADIARFLQYAGAAVLFGTALLRLMGLPVSLEQRRLWPKWLFSGAAVALAVGACLSLAAQSAMMNGVAISALTAPISPLCCRVYSGVAPVSSARAITPSP